jgi:hypothetical protein
MTDESASRAAEWLHRAYGDMVVLTEPDPIMTGERNRLYACGYADHRAPGAMLASTIAVPRSGGEPFPVSNADPLDEVTNTWLPAGREPQGWRWRVNARNCVVSTDAALDNRPSSALPWQPPDELPGWWDRLLADHFPDADVATCADWADVTSAIETGGPGTRGVVWLRRRSGGVEITGHLINVLHDTHGVVFLDGQTGSVARLDEAEADMLVLARFHRPDPPHPPITVPWELSAADLAAAVEKGTSWLDSVYAGRAVLVAPGPADEHERGWLFACETRRFLRTGAWQDQMLDASLVVPKAAGSVPFGLPNHDPWTWFARWDAGELGLAEPPEPGAAEWFAPTISQLGAVIGTTDHPDWASVIGELSGFPENAGALIWVHRQDDQGREAVGNLVVAANEPTGLRLVDGMGDGGKPELDTNPTSLRVIRFR